MPEYFTPKVTALHSVNAVVPDAYYIPLLEDFPVNLATSASKVKGVDKKEHSFAAVYDGWFDNEVLVKVVKSSDGNTIYRTSDKVFKDYKTRALETLGYDFLLKDEKCNMSIEDGELIVDYKPVLIEEDNIDTYTALMSIYKALGHIEYDIRYAHAPDNSLSLETSPIQQYINTLIDRSANLDSSEGKTWVWMSRTNRELYKEVISKDFSDISESGLALILSLSDADKASSDEINKLSQETITLGEFCMYLKELMLLYGEPVMTEQEETLLVQVYGKNLPYYMAKDTTLTDGSKILDAIKYLVAKGIINPDNGASYDFSGRLTLDVMLDMLMAVKDVNSRYTFKDVQLTLDSTLQNLGYFETTLLGNTSPILKIDTELAVGAEYYDYYVTAVDSLTNFTKDGILQKDNFCLVSNKGKKVRASEEDGVFYYVGEVSGEYNDKKIGFYHFRVKAGKSYLRDYLDSKNNLKIGCITSGTDVPYYKVKFGGGVYGYTIVNDKQSYEKTSSRSMQRHQFDNMSFTANNETLVDAERKEKAREEDPNVQTAAATTIPIKFYLSEDTWKTDIAGIKWKANASDTDGTSLAGLVNDTRVTIGNYTITRNAEAEVLNQKLRFFTVQGCTDLSDFRSHLMHDNIAGRYNEYQTFCQNGDNVLVNFDYLQDVGIAKRYVELEDEVVLLTTQYNNIYLCPKQKWIVVGNTIYDMPSGSLMYYKKDGKMFIDYKAALGWSGDYYIFKENNGQITLSLSQKTTGHGTTSKKVYTSMGRTTNSGLSVQVINDSIILSSTYPLANYFIFEGSDEAATITGDVDYLFVFKIKSSKYADGKKATDLYPDDTKARNKLSELLGASAPDNWLVYVYQLHKNKSKANPPGIYYNQKYGYIFKPQKYKSNWKKRYFESCLIDSKAIKGTEAVYKSDTDIVLPFLINDSKIYDVNFNIFKYKGKMLQFGRAPYAYLGGPKSSELAATWKPSGITAGNTVFGKASGYTITPAPTAVLYFIVNLGKMDYTILSQSSNKIYIGTMEAEIKESKSPPTLNIGDWSYGSIGYEPLKEFNILRSTSLGYVLGVSSMDTLTAEDSDRLANAARPEFTLGMSLAGFDWEKYKFKNLIEDADDFITIATIALLNFIPRIAMFIFILLIALSLITNVNWWIKICDNIFDIYKLLTLNRKDVHTVNTFRLFWSSILGLAVFGLFMDGTIINLIAWFVRAGSGIITR